MVETDAVLEVADGVLDLDMAPMAGLQFQGLAVRAGDECVIAVGGEQGQLRAGPGLHPPDDELYRRCVRLTLKGGVKLVSEILLQTNIFCLKGSG